MVAGRGHTEGEGSEGVKPRSRRRRDTAQVERDNRLAELVSGLTGSPLGGALHAVVHDDGPDTADALEVVARAMVKVDQPPPKELRLSRRPRPSSEDDDTGGDADRDADDEKDGLDPDATGPG